MYETKKVLEDKELWKRTPVLGSVEMIRQACGNIREKRVRERETEVERVTRNEGMRENRVRKRRREAERDREREREGERDRETAQ